MQGGVAAARRASTPLIGLLLAFLTWRQVNFVPVDSLDPSWQAALHMAARDRLAFDRIVFTYGPLGFLAQPEGYFPSTVVLSALYVFAVRASLCTALISVLRRTLGLPVAALATFLLVALAHTLGVVNAVVVVVVVVAFGLLRGDYRGGAQVALVAAGGVVAGSHLLIKLNTGVTVFIVGAVTAFLLDRRAWRLGALYLAATAGSLLAGWTVTGNGLADLVPFFDRSWEVASGYSEAMTIETGSRSIFYPAAAVATAVVVALAWRASRSWPFLRRLGLALAGAMWLFAAFKLGFVRHDSHDLEFFGQLLLVGAVFAATLVGSTAGWSKPVLPAAALAVLVTAHMMASGVQALSGLNAPAKVARAGEDLSVLASPAGRERAVQRARTNLRSRYYHLTPSIVAAVRGHTVQIRPWEAGIGWAYPEFRWHPAPVFQEYSAYTADLDELDAEFYRGADAPERILTTPLAIDIRNPDWESPAAMVAIVCHYREVLADHPWQVLGRVANRCGDERSLGVVKARVGETVAVPTAGRDELVVARIKGLDYSALYGVRTTLWRGPEVYVRLDGGRRNRLVPGTAANGLIMRAPRERLGFSQPFAPDSANLFRVERQDGIGLNQNLTIEFVAIPVLN